MSGGHEAVKTALAGALGASLATWVAGVQVSGWPKAPGFIGITDVPPDADKLWPCVLISSTAMVATQHVSAVGDGQFVGVYDVKVTVGVRAVKERDVESAIFGRDRLLLAVRRLLLHSPDLAGDGATVVLATSLTEATDQAAEDLKGRPTAFGEISLQIRHIETIPDPDAVAVTAVGTEVTAYDATGVLAPEPPPGD